MQLQDAPNLDLDDHPTRAEAQIAYQKGLELLSKQPECPRVQIAWLRGLEPVAVAKSWILVRFPNQEEAVQNGASEPFLRLGRCLHDNAIAAGLHAFSPKAAPPLPSRPAWNRRIAFMPAFLVSTTLPHRKPAGTEFERANGHTRTTLVAPRRPGLPFGVYARLILIHLATEAQHTQSRRLPAPRTINELLSQMRIPRSGGEECPYKDFDTGWLGWF